MTLLKAGRRLVPPPEVDLWPDAAPRARKAMHWARAAVRLVLALLWTALGCAAQGVLIMLPGRAKVVFARIYWSVFCRCIGLSVRVAGAPLPGRGRPVVFASNHSSWLDIPVLGGRLQACFVAKGEIARWPGISLVARLGRTVFVSRTRGSIGRERDEMQQRLAQGDNLMLFPEGTSSDGGRVMPFRSSFFSITGSGNGPDANVGALPPLVQPVSVVYDRLAGLPTYRYSRAVFAWYGGMDLASHFWRLAQNRDMRVTVLLHPPLDPLDFASRKDLSQAAWTAVAVGVRPCGRTAGRRPREGFASSLTWRGVRLPTLTTLSGGLIPLRPLTALRATVSASRAPSGSVRPGGGDNICR